MGITTPKISRSFNSGSGRGKEAYLILDNLFSNNETRESFISLENRYQSLLVRTWLPDTDPKQAETITREMEQIRRQQIELTSNRVTDPATQKKHDLESLFAKAHTDRANLTEWEHGNLRVMEHYYTYLSAFKKNPSLTDKYISTLRESSQTWAESLEAEGPPQAWKMQCPAFEAAFDVLKESMQEPANFLSARLGRPVSLSEAALNQLNPGVSGEKVAETLENMKPRYKNLVAQIRAEAESGRAPPILSLPEIPAPVQLRTFERLKNEILKGVGYDQRTLQDMGVNLQFTSSATGVCWGDRKNIVLSVETYPDDFAKSLGNAWHEIGHLVYLLDLNRLPDELLDKPVASFNGFGVHEAAAMTMEQAGLRKKSFELLAPLIKEELTSARDSGELPEDFNLDNLALSPENLYRKANRPNLSNMEWCTSELALAPNMAWRIKAFRDIFDGRLQVADLPDLWAKEMEEWTGIKHDPADFTIGEDHIFSGLGGYFWAYMTGAFTATGIQNDIARKGLAPDNRATDIASYSAPYLNVLREKIFCHGCKHTPDTLLQQALGQSIWDPDITNLYFERLACAAHNGMPAPDAALAEKYCRSDETPQHIQIKSQP